MEINRREDLINFSFKVNLLLFPCRICSFDTSQWNKRRIFFCNDFSLLMQHFLKADMLSRPISKKWKIQRNLYCKGTQLERGLITLWSKVPRTTENPPLLLPALLSNSKPVAFYLRLEAPCWHLGNFPSSLYGGLMKQHILVEASTKFNPT